MEYRLLGRTGIRVSRLCFGTLTIGPMQSNLDVEEGAKIIAKAISMGINFFDTAKLYNTYSYIRRAIELTNCKDIVVSSRSYDYTYEGMKESIDEVLEQLNIKQIGIFGLHEQESIHTLRGHEDALKYLVEAKKEGKVRAIGISTHNISAVEAASKIPEIDVIHPILNHTGLGINDGSTDEMISAIQKAKDAGKGIYSMKPIGGGNLIGDVKKCFDFVLNNRNIDSVAVGMQSENEVEANALYFEGRDIPDHISNNLRNTKRKLKIDDWCEGCGNCVERCKCNALKVINGKSIVNQEICKLCGYCAAVCPQFCIKII